MLSLSNYSQIANSESSILYKSVVYSLTVPIFFITAAGNGVILVTIKYQARLLSSTSNYFILSLALADFFVGIAIMPIMIVYTANEQKWEFNQWMCDSWMAFDFLCSSASFLTLTAMSIERYKMITSSYLHIKHSSKVRVIIFICLSWLMPFVTWVPVILVYRITEKMNKQNLCSMPDDKYLILFLCVIIYHIPLICMVVFYTKLIIHIKKSSLSSLECESSNTAKRNKNLNDSLFSHANENSKNFNYSTNYDQIRHPEFSIKKSNSSNFVGVNSFDSEALPSNRSFLLIFLTRFTDFFFSCCCKRDKNGPRKKFPKDSSKFVKYIPKNGRNTSLKVKQNLILTSPRKSKELSGQESDCLNSRKSSYNLKFDQDSTNSTMIRCKVQNNSMNNFIEYQEINNKKEPEVLIKRCSNTSLKKSSFYETSNYQNLRLKRNRKAARMLGLLVASFSICWLPYTIIYPFCQFYKTFFPNWFVSIVWWMGYINSTINPFLYVYSNKNIRQVLTFFCGSEVWTKKT
ncbi:histamine H1 receptor [Brachionus plicatilis]|uniref:Histamine H1 receptor n=1 Tax=Brachionus plicatilis TaxID=10195 RepID=A0A3M7SXZ2_BRAPC|nr:histamine H1 receptor [Brachionus plicatilis]